MFGSAGRDAAKVEIDARRGGLGVLLAFLAPALILYLVLFVTGVPPAEESSLRSRGDAYRAYQARTSVFVPWLPKS